MKLCRTFRVPRTQFSNFGRVVRMARALPRARAQARGCHSLLSPRLSLARAWALRAKAAPKKEAIFSTSATRRAAQQVCACPVFRKRARCVCGSRGYPCSRRKVVCAADKKNRKTAAACIRGGARWCLRTWIFLRSGATHNNRVPGCFQQRDRFASGKTCVHT